MKLLLVDLDGTIRAPKSGGAFIQEPTDQQPIPYASEALAHYHKEGWVTVGISNQGGVAAGYKTLEQCAEEQLYTLELFPKLYAIYFCPDFEGKECYYCDRLADMMAAIHTQMNRPDLVGTFRKPGSGMIHAAIWGELPPGEAPEDVLVIGDRPEDEQAAKAAGVRFQWAPAWRAEFDPEIPF